MLVRFVIKLVADDYPDTIDIIIQENKKVIKGYITGLLVEFSIVFVLSFTLLTILGIKYALMLAIIVAMLNIIPYLGIYTAILLVMFVTYANSSGGAAIQAGIALLVIHLIDGIFLLPRIVGARMKLNPFMTIIAVIVGDIVWGVPGMFLFIPLAAMLRIIFENISSLEAWAILLGEEAKKKKIKKHSL
jgi:AI-2 transport protein TqsA